MLSNEINAWIFPAEIDLFGAEDQKDTPSQTS